MTTAIDINTNKIITVKPIAICQSDACDTLLIADANTGKGIWMGYRLDWRIDPETLTTTPKKSKACTERTRKSGSPRLISCLLTTVLSWVLSTKNPEIGMSWLKSDFRANFAVPVMR